MHLHLGKPMTNDGTTLAFIEKSVHRLGTKDRGDAGRINVETEGPDNHLRLVVTTARS